MNSFQRDRARVAALGDLLDELRLEGQTTRIRVQVGADYGPDAEPARGLVALLRIKDRAPGDALQVVRTLRACRDRIAELEQAEAKARADERSRVLAEVADYLSCLLDTGTEDKLGPVIAAFQAGRMPVHEELHGAEWMRRQKVMAESKEKSG